MKSKLALVVGLGVGYVLGARAGRGRYEQIRQGWEGFTESEPVQRVVEPIKEAMEPMIDLTGTDDLPDQKGLGSLTADQVKERLHRTGSVTDTLHQHLPEEIVKERM
jgi:hypothetical protein